MFKESFRVQCSYDSLIAYIAKKAITNWQIIKRKLHSEYLGLISMFANYD